MLGLGLGLTNFGTKGGVVDTPDLSGSSAAAFLALWSTDGQGLVFDFANDQSAKIQDTSTPANNYSSSGIVSAGALTGPGGKITYTSPSTKLCRQQSGLYARQAHNLYLNSAAPANQSVTVVSGATYRMTITGSVSITVSGAATGTYTSGNNDFTAATTTLTCGSTSGSGTVHLRRTPSNDDYLATSGSQVYSLPYEWDTSGTCLGVRVEEARTNLCLYSNDLTQSNWLKIYGVGASDATAQVTVAKTATGPDNIANSASTVTASQSNAWVHQNISSASAARSAQVFLKRRTGTGAVTIAIGEKTGSELVTNGDFATDVSGWTNWGGGSIAFSSGTGAVTTDGSFQGAYQAITCTAGKLYAVTADVSVANGRIYINDTNTNSNTNVNTGIITAGTSTTFYFVANATIMYVLLSSWTASTTVNYDNVTVKEVAETTVDLSSGAWVRGTIENKTITNPCMAIKLATSGDAVDVAYAEVDSATFAGLSPIETFASSVTRAADNLSATDVVSFLTGPRTQFVSACVISYKTNINFLSVNNSASGEQSRSEIYYPYATSARSIMRDVAGSTIANINLSITTIASPRVIKEAAVYATDDMIFAVDGTTSAADTTGTIGTNANKIWIGRNYSGTNGACYIKSVAIFPERISNANLQSMTT